MAALSLYLLTFNCGRALVQPQHFANHVFDALDSSHSAPDVVVFNLQEIAPIGYSFLGGSFLAPYFHAFRHALELADKEASYVNVITRNLGMTAIMVFVRDDLVSNVAWLQSAGVGVGVQDMGNKGAAAIRMGYRTADEIVQMTFVSAHLAAMEDGLDRRNQDYERIVRGLSFVSDQPGKSSSRDERAEDAPLLPGQPGGEGSSPSGMYSPQAHLFFAGDLNYRTSETRPTEEDYRERFPQPTEDPQDPQHFSHLFGHDQLNRQLKLGKTLHGLSEAAVQFPPTYKYRQNSHEPVMADDTTQWNWAAHRWPSWCDRILYLALPAPQGQPGIQIDGYCALPRFATSDHRPVGLAVTLPMSTVADGAIASSDVRHRPPFSIDPDWRSKRAMARRKEIAVGFIVYLTWTYEGLGLTIATTIGLLGGWYVIRSMLADTL